MTPAQTAAKKFVSRASVASGDYAAGVQSSTKDQNALAIAAADRYKQGVQEAASKGRFEAGLRRAGKDAYLKGVREKGEARFADGVASSADKYAANSARYDAARQAAENLPKGSRGSETNYQRSSAVGKALRAVKVGSAS